MGVNNTHPEKWKQDTMESVSQFNDWFLDFAPQTYVETRVKTTDAVKKVFEEMGYLSELNGVFLLFHPEAVEVLRMCTCPPIARDRLAGLSGVSRHIIHTAEKNPSAYEKKTKDIRLLRAFEEIASTIKRMLDKQLFPWLETGEGPTTDDLNKAMLIIADRLCGSESDPIIRNAQENRQLQVIKDYLTDKGYIDVTGKTKYDHMQSGTFMFRSNVPGEQPDESGKKVNIPIDVLIKRKTDTERDLPWMIECKSAGDFANVNKRRKEEATKIQQLKTMHGDKVHFILFLCGYFDASYLGYEAAEGIDWIWEHRIEDFEECGI